MDKPIVVSEAERKKCKEALEMIDNGASMEEAVAKFPQCEEIIVKYVLEVQGGGE